VAGGSMAGGRVATDNAVHPTGIRTGSALHLTGIRTGIRIGSATANLLCSFLGFIFRWGHPSAAVDILCDNTHIYSGCSLVPFETG
jgi:hypothetical protein